MRSAKCEVEPAAIAFGGPPAMNILDPQGPIGAAEKTILINSVGIMLAIVLPTIVAIFAFAFWFRESNARARYQPDWDYSGRIELVVWAIPALTVILLGGVAWIGAHRPRPGEERRRHGRAARGSRSVSLDWKWLFIYPGPEHRSHQHAHRSGRRAAAIRTDFRQRDERVLHPAIRQHDLHHERHDDPAQSAGRYAGQLPRHFGAFQRRWILRHAFRRRCGAGRAVSEMGRRKPQAPVRPLDEGSYREIARPASNVQPRPIAWPTRNCSTRSRRRRYRPAPGRHEGPKGSVRRRRRP